MRRSYLVAGEGVSGQGVVVECDDHQQMTKVIRTWPAGLACGRITRRQAESPVFRYDERQSGDEALGIDRDQEHEERLAAWSGD